MRQILLTWSEADWLSDTEERITELVRNLVVDGLARGGVPPDFVELIDPPETTG